MAAVVSVSVFLGTILISHAFKIEDRRVMTAAFKEQQSVIRARVSQHMNATVIAIQRMADRWEMQDGTDYDLWRQDAANYIADFTALKAMSATDTDLRIKWIEPLEENESALGLYIAFEKSREEALQKAIKLNKATITPPVDLVQGYKALILYTPTYINGAFSGFINAIYDPLTFLDKRLSSDFTKNFHMILKDGDIVIFQTPGASDYTSDKTSTTQFSLLEREWNLTLKARTEFIENHRSYYSQIAFIVGCLSSILLGFLTYMGITSYQRNRLLKSQTHSLKKKEKEQDKLLEELALSNEELARFAYVCSHDLQEPLRMVQSFSQKLQTHLGHRFADDERGQLYFKFVIDGAKRSQILIKEILAYSEIDRDTHLQEQIDLNDIVEVVKTNLVTPLKDVQGEITYSSLPIVEGNKTQIYQLIQNLINNGLKYTGVGLAICKKVVERHKGTISVKSELGQGSTFVFTLPKAHSSALVA